MEILYSPYRFAYVNAVHLSALLEVSLSLLEKIFEIQAHQVCSYKMKECAYITGMKKFFFPLSKGRVDLIFPRLDSIYSWTSGLEFLILLVAIPSVDFPL